LQHLFRRFGKLDVVTRAGHVGTGLGLYICRQLAEAMGGQIWYEPVDPSAGETGSRFRVQLPLRRPEAADLEGQSAGIA
jgi:signal transduction histidine kinase